MTRGPITEFMLEHYKHFNAATVIDASRAWEEHLADGGKMFVTIAGAMSTAELGKSLAEMIRQDKIHGICCTGANLEEDIFNLVAHDFYERVPDWRALSADDEMALKERGMNRVTDTCIPEDEAIRRMEAAVLKLWQKIDREGKSLFPYEFFYEIIRTKALEKYYEIEPKNSWVIAACEKNVPILTPGWEDSTLGNIFVSHVITKEVSRYSVVRHGLEQMGFLVNWYRDISRRHSIGFFQIGGGIAGDFPICVVPLINQDLREKVPRWGYFCQISDSTTSYGSYSGAVPNEKITWGKLDASAPRFIIESDASIVAPMLFHYVLGV